MTKQRVWKLAGLIVGGGVIVQTFSCVPIALQVIADDLTSVLIQQFVTALVSAVVGTT